MDQNQAATKSQINSLPTENHTWARFGIGAVLAIFIILGLVYSIVNPLHEATDELRHYRFVHTIAATGKLPVQGKEPCRSQSHHPPLFYAIGALATAWIDTGKDICDSPPTNPFWGYRYWEVGTDNKNLYLHGQDEAFPWYGEALAAHIVRAINVLIGAGVVLLTWLTGRTIWPRRPALALGATAFVAFNPMFLYMASAINNDVIAAFSGTAVVLVCVRLLSDPARLDWRYGLWLGGVYGLALMSKFNLAPMILLIGASVAWAAWKKPFPTPATVDPVEDEIGDRPLGSSRPGRIKLWLVVMAITTLVAGVIAGWWFVRNQILYGEPTGFRILTELWGVRDPSESFGLAISELPYAWTTLWGRFGFGQVPLPQAIYDGVKIVVAAGLVGAILGFVRRASARERLLLIFLALNVLLFSGVLFNYMLVSPAGPNGRFFFPALASLALLIFFGLAHIALTIRSWVLSLGRVKRGHQTGEARALKTLAIIISMVMLTLSLITLMVFIAPAYARPPELAVDAEIPNRVEVHFNSLATLLGYELSTLTVHPGEEIDIDLYWQVNAQPPGIYHLFVHLIDDAGTMVAQRDTHPGLGKFPTDQWQPGDRFMESIRLILPETAYSPASATLSLGLYAPDAYRLAISDRDGKPLGDAFPLSNITIKSKEGPTPNSQNHNFNNEIRLVGYEYSQRQATPGTPVEVILFWEAIQDGPTDYVVQVRLLDEGGNVWAAADSRPQKGASLTNAWTAGQTTADRHLLMVDPETPTGTYFVEVALKDVGTGQRQNIVGQDGHWIDSRVKLAGIKIDPDLD